MTEQHKPMVVTLPKGGFSRTAAVDAVGDADLPDWLIRFAPGAFGQSVVGGAVLESLVDAVDLGLMAAADLEGVILEALSEPGSFDVPALTPAHDRLIAAWQLVVTCDDALRRLADRCPAPTVEGALELDGLDELLDGTDRQALATRVMTLAGRYLDMKAPRYDSEAGLPEVFAGTTLAAFFQLLRRALLILSRTGALRPLVETMAGYDIRVAGYPYEGLLQQTPTETPSGLLPMWPENIVGNDEFLDAGRRLARDVAGFDLELGRNPKRVNPVLFGLGAPGCGKTVTAHAVGNYFLKFCREREIRARFIVVRRSDWASSYQNASAANLIRLFREEVYGFDGVCGVYWPDIDTALASRSNAGLRSEEKQNLGAVFGIFDGTLLPKDGKWFLICDANTMHMDEAAVSRIAQNPLTVAGPTLSEHYVRLMRDLLLKDVSAFVTLDDEAWGRVGQAAIDNTLSGRNVESICGNVRAHIQDFEYPDDYFRASADEREGIIARLSRQVDEAFIMGAIADWAKFRKEAQEREAKARFDDEVESVVRQLNAGRAAMEKAAELGIGT